MHSYSDILRWTLLGALGAPLAACGGTTADSDSDGGAGSAGTATATGSATGSATGTSTGSGAGTGTATGTSTGTATGTATGTPIGKPPACTNPTPLDGGFVQCDEGYTHRGEPKTCPSSIPRAEAIGDPLVCDTEAGCCIYDADCEAGQYCNGASGGGQIAGSWCSSGCVEDSDCGDNQICQCGDPIGHCVQAECETDADCEGDYRCASYQTDSGCGAIVTFTCQTAADTCGGPGDCAEGQECLVINGARACQDMMFTCAAGRPFLIDGAPCLAEVTERSDWLDGGMSSSGAPVVQALDSARSAPLDAAPLDAALQAALTAAWTEAAQMEHASVAAFARFSLQLLSLGAPSELVTLSGEAQADEMRHAKLCFSLASRYAGRPLGPTPLSLGEAPLGSDAFAIMTGTILEGCIGETIAALEAQEASQAATDPEIRAVLSGIADDESRHAELAWKAVGWLLTINPGLLAHAVQAFKTGMAAAASAAFPADRASPHALLDNGVLDQATKKKVRALALSAVIAPCFEALLASPAALQPRALAETEVQKPAHVAL